MRTHGHDYLRGHKSDNSSSAYNRRRRWYRNGHKRFLHSGQQRDVLGGESHHDAEYHRFSNGRQRFPGRPEHIGTGGQLGSVWKFERKHFGCGGRLDSRSESTPKRPVSNFRCYGVGRVRLEQLHHHFRRGNWWRNNYSTVLGD